MEWRHHQIQACIDPKHRTYVSIRSKDILRIIYRKGRPGQQESMQVVCYAQKGSGCPKVDYWNLFLFTYPIPWDRRCKIARQIKEDSKTDPVIEDPDYPFESEEDPMPIGFLDAVVRFPNSKSGTGECIYP